ncbi:DNA-3-methyladenine glycosylase I, partial [Pirellulaceae bacterium]|nr:DNA-3-methyladenine glycosylase I [Pirellulaceae bacterium]
DDKDVDRLLGNQGIVRHRGKIEATINNARRAIEVVDEFGSLAAYVWRWAPSFAEPHVGKSQQGPPIPCVTKTSQALSKDLKKRGWKFFRPTTAYAFMQAMGMVNDHLEVCASRQSAKEMRDEFESTEKANPSTRPASQANKRSPRSRAAVRI